MRSISTEYLIHAWQENFAINVADHFSGVLQIDLFQCHRCHLQFFRPDYLEGSPSLYAQLGKFEWYYMPHKWEHDAALADLRNHQTVLEVGCGGGDFVATALEKGWQIEGIELNESAVLVAQQRGLPVRRLDLREAAEHYPSRYDAVCIFQVLEHVQYPKSFLQWLCLLIKPGGILALGLPNAESFLKHEFNVLDMPPHHMTRWSPKTIVALPEMFPLELKHMRFEPLAHYHADSYCRAMGTQLFKRDMSRRVYAKLVARPFALLLKRTGLHKRLTGQSIYACYERT